MILTSIHIARFSAYLQQEDKSAATQGKYLRDVQNFLTNAGSTPITKELVLGWKKN